jgi:hypothetical protein
MIIKIFFKVNSNKNVIVKLNLKFYYENFKGLVTLFKNNLHTGTRLRSRAKNNFGSGSSKMLPLHRLRNTVCKCKTLFLL